jgi:quercetin dioxygenase-like cupin family protein
MSHIVPRNEPKPAPAGYFSGQVSILELITSPEPMSLSVFRVSFAAGARTAWHTHPQGQILHVESGLGWFQRDGENTFEIKPGDTVYIPPLERHWHGASADHAMTHLAMQRLEDGVSATWFELVSDEAYRLQ